MIRRFQLFLGPGRLRALFLLLAITGLFSLLLNTVEDEWATGVQTLLVLVFLVGAAVIIGGRLEREARLRWLAILAPAVGAIILGLTVLPDFLLPLAGAAVGWIIAGAFLFRPRIPKEYQEAIRYLRKSEYDKAVKSLDGLIKADPQNEDYYRLRGDVFRVWGKLDRARRDFQQSVELMPDSAVGYSRLAEVYLQMGRPADAQQPALKAYELTPNDWVAAYNLGMIEDRLGESEAVIQHLNEALALKVPDARHRLLIHLYLARAYQRMGQGDAAQEAIEKIRQHKNGLDEWLHLLKHEQAATLRAVLEADVRMAQAVIEGTADETALV